MSSSRWDGVGDASDREFERALVESARADELPTARVEAAWSDLAGALAAGASVAAAPLIPALGGARVARAIAAKWLVLGALCGGAATAAWMAEARHAHPTPAVALAPPASLPPLELDRARIAAPELEPGLAAGGGARAMRRVARGGSARESAPVSTLAAEVAALDAARAAAADRPDETLRLVARYHYDFPEGELTADAEVIAMEALAAQGERADLAARAARFLARYPNDPHAAEVRHLGGQ